MHRLLLPLLFLPSMAIADMSAEAEVCIDELRSTHGNIGGEVVRQEFSEAAIMVVLRDNEGIEYECIVWSGPVVADLSRADAPLEDAETVAAVPVVSGDQIVRFDPGTSGTAMNATLAPETSVRYILGARAGQFLNVDIGASGGAIDYKITNPDGSDLLEPISSETPYQGELWQSGDHGIEVINTGAQPVTFDIGIGIN